MDAKPILAWHFVGKTLRNCLPIPKDGEWLEVAPPLRMCERGLHASLEPFDALKYAPGDTLCLVEVAGEIIKDTDKLVASKRRILARMDATEMLQYFARMQALSVVHLWDAPDDVVDYLMTGDESIRDAAWDAARDAAWAAAWDAARYAAWDAARDAAWAAARAAARDAALAAARDAARDAALAAARDAAWAAARAAARDAAWAAARNDFNDIVYECFEGPLNEYR